MRNRIRRNFWVPVLASALLLCSSASAIQNFSITTDGELGLRMGGAGGYPKGLGGDVLLDLKLNDLISLGTALGTLHYFNGNTSGATNSTYIDLEGRLMPFGMVDRWQPYLLGGVGLNLYGNPANDWQGNYHAQAGIGTRYFVSPQAAVDFAAIYNLYSPMASSLQTVGLRMGISLFFEPEYKPGASEAKTKESAPAKALKTKAKKASKAKSKVKPKKDPEKP